MANSAVMSPEHSELPQADSLELHRRRRRRFLIRREGRARVKVQDVLCGDIGRKIAHRFVVFRNFLDIALARDGDAIFGALELRLEITIILIRLQLRVTLYSDEKPRERAG